MLFYFIPFLLLLVVALVLKQREGKSAAPNDKNSKAKTAPVKSNKKSTAKSRRAAAAATEQTSVAENTESTAVAPALLQKLQQLIHGGHYGTAEAQINQALNRDDKQHELYLLLLKLHLLQKDELATNQLLNYIRGLKIPSLLAEAENKRQEYEQMQAIEHDFLHDNLVVEKIPARAPQSFDQFQQQHKLNQAPETDPHHDQATTNPAEPLADFDFSQFDFNPSSSSSASAVALNTPEQTQKIAETSDFENTTTSAVEQSSGNPIDFANDHATETTLEFTLENQSDNSSPVAQHNDAALNFSLTDDTTITPTHMHTSPSATTANQSDDDLSFNFNFESNANDLVAPTTADTTAALSLETPSTKPDLEFEHFSFSLANESDHKTVADEQPTNTLNFAVDEATQTPSLSFNLSETKLDLAQNSVIDPSPSDIATTEIRFNDADSTITDLSLLGANHESEHRSLDLEPSANHQTVAFSQQVVTEDDELIQQFPQLKHLNQVQLDLDLAQRYIEFAAFDAARSLCSALQRQDLTVTQQEKLLTLQQQLQSKPALTTD